MRQFFWIIVVLSLSVWLGLKISEDPGYLILGYKQWTVEMPLWVAFLGLALLLFVFYFTTRFFERIETTWLRLKNWLRLRRKYRSYSKTNRGLIELLEGDLKGAEYYLLEGANRSDIPLVNYLAAALAAHEQGLYDKRDLYLQRAQNLVPQAEVAIGLMRAQLQLNQGQLEQAMATLNALRFGVPKHRQVLRLLEKIYIRLGDWEKLQKLLPQLRKVKLITKDQQQKFEAHVYEQLLKNISANAQQVSEIRDYWKTIPRVAQKNTALMLCYAKKLLPFAHTSHEIENLLTLILKKHWNEEAIYLYGMTLGDDPHRQLAIAESWLKQYGYQAMLFLTLGKLCMRCQLWGKARSYFEQSLKADARSETYLEYGKLLERLGEVNHAFENYRLGLSTASEEHSLVPVKPILE
jgi:HemY protein